MSKTKEKWELLDGEEMLFHSDVGGFFNIKEKAYPVRGFVNTRTGEIRLFHRKAVDRLGEKGVVEILNKK